MQKQTVSTINNLIETLKDGEKGFRDAAEAVRDAQVKTLFRDLSQQRSRFATELQGEAKSLGESEPEDSGSASGAMHRAWIGLKSAITSQDDHAILAECERGEDSAVKEYREALDQSDLAGEVRTIVQRQFTEVKAAHDKVRDLRDARANK
jgi:uncharacterized protein (TIGR02284 family)